ncbi:cupin domain-containing protein [Microbispora sp. RL4-1S]|uniref:Cupin domain-containing protein n=1 Tax=Microbispora oryzae TaxID=2806554 RepID=A0A940WQN4_9ACTN|nr:cupin domain-containing protein [Microbispora oryzae]MBP2707508.1 cupin domain-containing protein [Microbispora oryzae]
MSVIRAAEARRSETPGGVMTTFASPTQGDAGRSLWRVDAFPGAAGPLHDFDTEQVWTFLEGAASIELGDDKITVGPGDTVVIPAATPRRVMAGPEAGYSAVVTSAAGAQAILPDGTVYGVPPWIA